MKLTYKNQLIISVVIVLLFDILSSIFEHWAIAGAGKAVCGLLWIFHPVLPQSVPSTKKNLALCRIAGVVLLFIAVFVRSYFY